MRIIFAIVITFIMLALFGAFNNYMTPANIGVKGDKLSELSKWSDSVSTQTNIYLKKVIPLKYYGRHQQTKDKLIDVLKTIKSASIITNEQNYIYVVFTSKLGLNDDGEFYFDDYNQIVEYRGASRIIFLDLGINKKRYEEIRTKYSGK